jgi:hypothetical protein
MPKWNVMEWNAICKKYSYFLSPELEGHGMNQISNIQSHMQSPDFAVAHVTEISCRLRKSR